VPRAGCAADSPCEAHRPAIAVYRTSYTLLKKLDFFAGDRMLFHLREKSFRHVAYSMIPRLGMPREELSEPTDAWEPRIAPLTRLLKIRGGSPSMRIKLVRAAFRCCQPTASTMPLYSRRQRCLVRNFDPFLGRGNGLRQGEQAVLRRNLPFAAGCGEGFLGSWERRRVRDRARGAAEPRRTRRSACRGGATPCGGTRKSRRRRHRSPRGAPRPRR
jgi:hypothetical protein